MLVSGPSARNHAAQAASNGPERSIEIGIQDACPDLVGVVDQGMVAGCRRSIDQDVDRSEPVYHVPVSSGDIAVARHVERTGENPAPVFEGRRRRLVMLAFVHCGDVLLRENSGTCTLRQGAEGDVGTGLGQSHHDGTADAGGSTGHPGDAPFQKPYAHVLANPASTMECDLKGRPGRLSPHCGPAPLRRPRLDARPSRTGRGPGGVSCNRLRAGGVAYAKSATGGTGRGSCHLR